MAVSSVYIDITFFIIFAVQTHGAHGAPSLPPSQMLRRSKKATEHMVLLR
jgi:hypothetical protein